MVTTRPYRIISLLMTAALACSARAGGRGEPDIAVNSLRCEYRDNPLGMDVRTPRLSWILKSGTRGERQTAYEVQVAGSAEGLARGKGDLWDSGKVASDASIQVEYAGKPLTSRRRCFWKVRVWARDGKPSPWSAPAYWTMGLLSPADWQARWIGVRQIPERPAPARQNRPAPVITHALYQTTDGAGERDVTALLAGKVHDGGLSLPVGNADLGGDFASGHRKRLHVEYEYAGRQFQTDVPETQQLNIPEGFMPIDAERSPFATPRTLRKAFTVNGPVRRATLYATALGLYELRLNGSRVGDHLLAPEWTNYHKRVQVQTYDVTSLLHPGSNALGALLGNGWYCGGWQHWENKLRPIYGDQPYLRVQLEIERADGTRQIIASNGSWHGTTEGPLRFSGIYEGETYDARREMLGWDTAHFNERAWRSVTVATPRVGALVWQRSEPIRVTQELKPVSVSEPKPGVYVFDLGQNIAGWCRLHLREPAGAMVMLKLNEMLNPDGTVYMANLHAGHLSSGDRQIVRYSCRGGEETYAPHFTYQGFRYVEVSGLTRRPAKDFLTGVVFHTSFARTGDFTCSNPLVNRLVRNIQWSQRANTMGVPTDCCQRDERCGYTGDAQFFMPTALYNFNEAAFFNKWLVDVCEDSQRPDGTFGDHAPDYGMGGDNVGWSDAGIICPYLVYRAYGDTRVLRDHYAAMRRNMMMLFGTAHGDTRGPDHVGNGDWLNRGGGASPEVIGTAYYAYDVGLMAEIAHVLGKEKDAAEYAARAAKIRVAFAQNFVDAQGHIKDSSQTGYALAFTMGLAPVEEQKVMAARFVEEIQRFQGHLATGFIGTPRLLPALHRAGRDDVAYRLLLTKTFPSWLYPVTLGATTMWERWDGWRPETGFTDSGMNSFNHYAFGAVGEYLFGMVGGIQAASPGYKTIRIQPVIGDGLAWAKTSFESQYGRIVSNWKRTGERLTLDVTIPVNATATVTIPAPDVAHVMESGKPAAHSKGVTFLRREAGACVFAVQSGVYRFTAGR